MVDANNKVKVVVIEKIGLTKTVYWVDLLDTAYFNAHFEYALRFIKRNYKTVRLDSLARKLQNDSYNDFWTEVRARNNCKMSLPTNIDGASGSDQISQM